jgi:signal transduction histidine kinase
VVDADGLNKALMNLLSNSLDALHGRAGAEVVLASENHNGNLLLRVKDNGPGISAENITKIFQPFFSTKGSQGNGLGLSMTRKYIEDMHGRLDVKSELGKGCEFVIALNVPN